MAVIQISLLIAVVDDRLLGGVRFAHGMRFAHWMVLFNWFFRGGYGWFTFW